MHIGGGTVQRLRLGPTSRPRAEFSTSLLALTRASLGEHAYCGCWRDAAGHYVVEAFAPGKGYYSARSRLRWRAVELLEDQLAKAEMARILDGWEG